MQINKLTIYVGNYNQTRQFYKEVMGLSVYTEAKQQITFTVGTSQLTIHEAEEYASCYHFAFNIPLNLFHAAKVWLSSRVELAKEDGEDEANFIEQKAKSIYFEDPAGNIVELVARQTSVIVEEASFHVCHLLNISEVGIATNDIMKLASEIQSKGIPVRHKESIHREQFLNFFGEYDDGVYIIVAPIGRWWIFSNIYATEAPIVIKTDRGAINIRK